MSVEDIAHRETRAGEHGFCGLQGASPHEDRQAGERLLLVGFQQVVRPVDRGPQRLVAFDAPTAGQQPEPLAQAMVELVDREHPHAGCRQLDGEWDAVQPVAHPGHRVPIVVSERQRRVGVGGTAGEELERRRLVERRHGHELLARDPQTFPARRQDRHRGPRTQTGLRDPSRLLEQVLAVVEHEEQTSRAQRAQQDRFDALAEPHLDGQHRRQHLHDALLVHARQLDEPHAVGVAVDDLGGHLHGEPGLADPTDPRERHHPVLGGGVGPPCGRRAPGPRRR